MEPNPIRPIIAIILALMLVTVPGFSKPPASDIRVTVRLWDYVDLPARERSEIMAAAKWVLGQAGVPVEFLECRADGVGATSPACTAPLGPTDLILRILQPKSKRRQLGYAAMTPEGGAFITVFINPDQRTARVDGLSDGVFLGYAVAHEIAHLLLGANSHSSAGIMRASWRPIEEKWMAKGRLLFDAGQARKMRSAVAMWASR